MILYIIVITLALIGGVSTMLVGHSQENKKANPGYERKTRANITKLILIYVFSLIAFIVIWMIFK